MTPPERARHLFAGRALPAPGATDRDHRDEPAGSPGAGPALDGPFVEVRPGAWVRATAVAAVHDHALSGGDSDARPRRPGGEPYPASVLVAAPGGAPVWWPSRFPAERLRTAVRLAEHREAVRRRDLDARRAQHPEEARA